MTVINDAEVSGSRVENGYLFFGPIALTTEHEHKFALVPSEERPGYQRLTEIEYNILKMLIQNSGRVCSVKDLHNNVDKNVAYEVERQSISASVMTLRKKVEEFSDGKVGIVCVGRKGWKIIEN